MLASLAWLRSLCPIEEDVRQVADALTSRGLTVDSVETADDDHALDIDVPANRPDCLGHLGLARELSAAFGVPLREVPARADGEGGSVDQEVRVEIDDKGWIAHGIEKKLLIAESSGRQTGGGLLQGEALDHGHGVGDDVSADQSCQHFGCRHRLVEAVFPRLQERIVEFVNQIQPRQLGMGEDAGFLQGLENLTGSGPGWHLDRDLIAGIASERSVQGPPSP